MARLKRTSTHGNHHHRKGGQKGSAVVPTDGAQRQQVLLDALWSPPEKKAPTEETFAVCKTIKHSQGFFLKSFHTEGAGELQLPLSADDASKLQSVCEQAPFGKGLATVVDTGVRCYWQVDASKVTFPETPTFLSDTIQPLAEKVGHALGFSGLGVKLEARLCKLLFYKAGGHITFHRDTEKERGMIGTLVLQLPTEEGYTGGKLIVRHHKEEKHFECHMVSRLRFCYTAFVADCLHELHEIESGTRLSLVFNLIKCDAALDPLPRDSISSKLHSVEAALEPWLREATEGSPSSFGGKLAIPLRHKYTEGNLSFSRLEGDDSSVAEVLRECRDENREPWLDLHLCLATNYQRGVPSRPRYYGGRHYNYGSDSGSDSDSDGERAGVHHIMEDLLEEKIEFKNWIGVDDRPPAGPFKDLGIDLKKEVVVGMGAGPFYKPDDEEFESYLPGNSGPKLEYWYHLAMLVLWPRRKSISIACEAGVSGALNWLESTTETTDRNFSDRLLQVVCYCDKNMAQVWEAKGDPGEDSVTPRLINLCTSANLPEILSQVFQVLAKDFQYRSPKSYGVVRTAKVGVRNAEVVKAIATSIQVFGWDAVSSSIFALVKECALRHGESFAQLAKECYAMEIQSAGAVVSSTMFEVFEARIAELGSHKMPVFTWCQLHAQLPEYPDIEAYLRGPNEKYLHPLQGLPNARSFVGTYFNHCDTLHSGYSATATAGGRGLDAFCEIRKTRYLFKIETELWHKEQEVMQDLKSRLEKLRSDVHEPTSAAMTATGIGQLASKRQRLDSEVPEDTMKRARSGTAEVIHLTDDVHESQ